MSAEQSGVRDLVARAGHYAECAGRRFPILAHGEGWVTVLVAPTGEDAEAPPEALEGGSNQRGTWARLPTAVLDRRLAVTVTARWRGERVTVGPVVGDSVVVYYSRSPARARKLGMTGDQYLGWEARAQLPELTDLEVAERQY